MAETRNDQATGAVPLPTPPPITPEEAERQEPIVEQLPHATLYQRFIRSLDIGQVISAVLVLLALAMILIQGDNLPRETTAFSDLAGELADGEGAAVLDLGILSLILTPVLYVLSGLFTFIQERDRLFITVTLVLIGILSTSVLVASL